MKKLLISIFCIFLFAVVGYSQTPDPVPTPNTVTISREAAIKALQDADTVKAQAKEIETLNQAITDLKVSLNDMRFKFAEVSGANSELRQNAVSDRAIIDLLLKNARPKKIGLINF